jgi:thiol:disulfide interchange protein
MVVLTAVAFVAPATTAPKGVPWQSDLDKCLAQAKKQHKPVLICFSADWCGWCERMDQDTLTDPKIVELAKRFVPVRIDTSQNRKVMVKYAVRSMPTIVVCDASGREVARVSGYRPASSLAEALREALRSWKTGTYRQNSEGGE